jgi:PKD repeat protein
MVPKRLSWPWGAPLLVVSRTPVKPMRSIYFVLAIAVAVAVVLAAEEARADEFWLANLPHGSTGYPTQIAVVNPTATAGTATITENGITLATLVVPAMSTGTYNPPNQLAGTTTTSLGIFKVTTPADWAVHLLMPDRHDFQEDSLGVIERDGWGQEYYALSLRTSGQDFLTIIAREAATTVSVTPSVTTLPGGTVPTISAGTTYTTTLAAGEALHLRANGDVTGSRVTADKDVAVFSGNPCSNIGASFCDKMAEQMHPVKHAGKEFVACSTLSTRTAGFDRVRVVATEPGTTTVTVTPTIVGSPFTLTGPGQHVWFDINVHSVITTDKDVLVAEYLGKVASDVDGGDPAMVTLTPTDFYSIDHPLYALPGMSPYPFTNYAVVAAAPGTSVTVDGVAAATPWSSIAGTSWGCMVHPIATMTHVVASAAPSSVGLLSMSYRGTEWLSTDKYVSIPVPPVANFTWAPLTVCHNFPVTFTDASFHPRAPTQWIVTARWDMGDATPTKYLSPPASFSHTYTAPGTYNVVLNVTDNQGLSHEVSYLVTASNCPPVLDPLVDWEIYELEEIKFTVSASDPNGDPLTYSISKANLPPDAKYASNLFYWKPGKGHAGTYTPIRFSVMDPYGGQDEQNITIIVRALPDPKQPGSADSDGDGVPDGQDPCPNEAGTQGCPTGTSDGSKPSASDEGEADGSHDPSILAEPELDTDKDGIPDSRDNCPFVVNPGQFDLDRDGLGDACDPDVDGDGVPQLDGGGRTLDNCPLVPNANQKDSRGDGIGDACRGDSDGDGIQDDEDECPWGPASCPVQGKPAAWPSSSASSGRSAMGIGAFVAGAAAVAVVVGVLLLRRKGEQ